jgi:2-polyprenyl-6-methoxyphenol hydroxylase-like FAD-dependent oxidoreductase
VETQRVIIVGGSVAGLAAALALKNSGREVIVLERDPEPPDISAIDAFDAWRRAGVPQFYHAHMLLARAQKIIREDHPELLVALENAGVPLSGPDELQPWIELGMPAPAQGDTDLDYVVSRRATFEYVLRQHVGSLPNVRFVHGARVTSLVTTVTATHVQVEGVVYQREGRSHELHGDLVIDASGKRTRAIEWLRLQGVTIDVEAHPCEYVYLCRHYRLNDPDNSPPRARTGGVLDYLGFGIFYGEQGHFSIGLACPIAETELVAALKTEAGWDALCSQIPVLDRWASAASVTSKVLGAGRFENRWINYRTRKGRELLGFVALGDSLVQTNPQFGRGMTMAFMQARILARLLAQPRDLQALARDYYAEVRAALRKHYEFCLASDRLFVMRAKRVRGIAMTLPQRIFDYLYANAWHPAIYSSGVIATETLRAMHMYDAPSFSRHIVMSLHIVRAFVLYLLGRIDAPPLTDGPTRAEMVRLASSFVAPRSIAPATPGPDYELLNHAAARVELPTVRSRDRLP